MYILEQIVPLLNKASMLSGVNLLLRTNHPGYCCRSWRLLGLVWRKDPGDYTSRRDTFSAPSSPRATLRR